ncbi:MAG: hypothetical protein KJ558_08260 [Gammaproteobacteria bacterium]|nr:hypothetical protein [Gammaproteobacteria bacterium]MBU1654806.1 hypothetical protein [Gammaproteobacteria bacterium]MBU1960547.1 hypothetical protein [Gammaproteobacteria bacterium]
MEETPADINRIIEALGELIEDFSHFWDDSGNPDPASGNSPLVIFETLADLLEMLYDHETAEQGLGEDELTELGNYGLDLLDSLEMDTGSIGYPSHQLYGDLALPLALWLARQGADIEDLSPVVNALARIANRRVHPEELERLFSQSSEIMAAVSPVVTQDPERQAEGAPWSLMLLNRAIIATRSLMPELMELAFRDLVEQLPQAAPDFFREGMEQMELLGYPPPVRALVERYYNAWGGRQLLH